MQWLSSVHASGSSCLAILWIVALGLQAQPARAADGPHLYTMQAGFALGSPPEPVLCPGNSLLVGAKLRSDQWMKRITLTCVDLTGLGYWSGEPIDGPVRGSQEGRSGPTYLCPQHSVIAAHATAAVRLLASDRIFVSFPGFRCVNLRTGETHDIGGPLGSYFGFEQDSLVMGDREIDGSYGCTTGWAARGVVLRQFEDGFDRFGLVCAGQPPFADRPVPSVDLTKYHQYTPTSVPEDSVAPPGTPPLGVVVLTCPDRATHMVGWSIDAGQTGLHTVRTWCAPFTAQGWVAGTETAGEQWQSQSLPAGLVRKYLCPNDSVVVGAAVYKALYRAPAEVVPRCNAHSQSEFVQVASAGIEPRGPFLNGGVYCSVEGGMSARVTLNVTDTVQSFWAECPGGLYVGEELGICKLQPQLCARRPIATDLFPGASTVVPASRAPAAPPPTDLHLCARNGNRYVVPANVMWCSTDIKLEGAGERLRISATGRWSNAGPPTKGPEGFAGYKFAGTILEGTDLAALIARVGSSAFEVGARFDGRNSRAGTLELSMNDTAVFEDNQGAVEVTVEVLKE